MFIFLIYATGCTNSTANPSNTPETKKAMNSSTTNPDEGVLFKRSTLVIADIDRSLKVYRDILGFSIFGEIEESDADSYSYPVFKIPRDAKIRFVTLNSPSQERTMALTEVKGAELPKPGVPLMSAIVIRVNDLQGTMQKIQALNLEATKMKSVETDRINYREQAFIDFDGHLIVLYETF